MSHFLVSLEIQWKKEKTMDDSDKVQYGLNNKTLSLLRDVFSKHPQIYQVLIYGSRAKGNYRVGSDIDLTLKGQGISLETLLKIENELDDLLLPYKFDVSIYFKITDKDLLEHITRVGKLLFQSDKRSS